MFKILAFLSLLSLNLHAEENKIDYWVDRSAGAGDVVLNSESNVAIVEQDIALTYDRDRGTIYSDAGKWPKATIIWEIDSRFKRDPELKDAVLEAIDKIEKVTVLRFKKRSNESDYVNIIRDQNLCYSKLGRVGGAQNLSIGDGCATWDTVAHEFFHAAGLLHEHTRSDRDNFIKINWENMGPSGKSNFSVLRHKTVGPFDFDSIMLYRSFAYYPFVLDDNIPMWTRLDTGLPMRNNNTNISFYDIKALADLYYKGTPPNPNPNPDSKVKCESVEFAKGRSFEKELFTQLSNTISNSEIKCVSVNSVDEYTIENLPDSLNDWMTAIVDTNGTIKKIEVSRSWLKKVFDFIVKVITGKDLAKMREVASYYNAEIYYDKDTTNLIEVKFLKRD